LTGYRLEYQELGSTIWERVYETTTLLFHTVRNLQNGKQYRFRIYAENMVGLSPPLNGDPVTARDPFNPPGAPSTPEVTGYDTNMVALKWNPPRDVSLFNGWTLSILCIFRMADLQSKATSLNDLRREAEATGHQFPECNLAV
jgi:hypothetical protein